ncbi:MAG: NAD-dependent epimerase/dehydratase family protein [Sandaracinaceae bacterium]
MSRYLITGATTPIGDALIRELLKRDDCARIVAVGAEPIRARAMEIDGRVKYERVDLTRERNLRELLFGVARREAIEVVVDMASHRSVRVTGARARALNVLETQRLLLLCEEHPTIRRFVYRSYAEVHDVSAALPALIDEAHPLNLRPDAPQWIRDRVEADLTVCTRMGMSDLEICVMRCAECLAARTGSQLHDYLESKVCFTPLGYDPVVNLISEEDIGRALALAARSNARGIFTIPGVTTLPLSEVIRKTGRRRVGVPGPAMAPLYRLRRAVLRSDFDYSLNRGRLHYGVVLSGARAEAVLGYTPQVSVTFARD